MTTKKPYIRLNSRFVVLALLAEKESHGLELMKRAAERTEGAVTLSSGTLYPLLKTMSDRRLRLIQLVRTEAAAPAGGRPAEVYAITEKGHKALQQYLDLNRLLFLGK